MKDRHMYFKAWNIFTAVSTVVCNKKKLTFNKKSYIYKGQVKGHIPKRQINHQNQLRYETDIVIIRQEFKIFFIYMLKLIMEKVDHMAKPIKLFQERHGKYNKESNGN